MEDSEQALRLFAFDFVQPDAPDLRVECRVLLVFGVAVSRYHVPPIIVDLEEPPAASRSAGLPAVGALTTHAAAASELDLSGPLIFASAQASRASRV